jgi:hypothetical protein
MKQFYIFILLLSTGVQAQHTNKPPSLLERYEAYLDSQLVAGLNVEKTYLVYEYTSTVKKATVDLMDLMNPPVVQFIQTDSGLVFYNRQVVSGSASFGLVKNMRVEESTPDGLGGYLIKDIYFDWHYQNSYDDATGVIPVHIYEQSNLIDDVVNVEIRIQAEYNRKRERFFRHKHLLYFKAYRYPFSGDLLERT